MPRTKAENLLIELENRHWAWAETKGMLQNCSDREYGRLESVRKKFNQQYNEARERLIEEIRRLEEFEELYNIEKLKGWDHEESNI